MKRPSFEATRVRLQLTELEPREVPAFLAGTGLTATYYDNKNFTGASITRVDSTIDFNWGTGSPSASIAADSFSAVWSGMLVPKFSEVYTFIANSDEGVRVWVNNTLIINNWTDHTAAVNRGQIRLTAGQPVNIRVGYYENVGSAVMRLAWSSARQTPQIIPTECLYVGQPTQVPSVPAAPARLTATPVSSGSVLLNWSDTPTETAYVIERSTDGTNFTPIRTTLANITSFSDTSLTAGTNYWYRVRGTNSAGSGAATAAVPVRTLAAPAPTVPAAPSGLAGVAASSTSISLNWTDRSSNETSFAINRSTDGVNFTNLATVGANATSYTDSGLAPGTTYWYRVRALNTAGVSAASAMLAVRTLDSAGTVYVSNTTEFRTAVNAATPGTTILLRPGVYEGGSYFSNLHGQAGLPIVIAAADPANLPIIRGGNEGLHFTDISYVELRNLIVEGSRDNGINIDDGDSYATPSHHITFSGLIVRNIGSTGNQDGIKLSGVDWFTIQNCRVTTWGGGGSGIDMVGCHDGVITGSYFAHGDTVGANGVQTKGGSARVVIRGNHFEHAGTRAVQIGGSTGLSYFRPGSSVGYEASAITVEGNVIVGSEAAVAFVNVDGATVRYNTIYRTTRYVFRILQETTDAGFVPCRNGVVTDNLIVFRSEDAYTGANVGPNTAPETFQFARNWWHCLNAPGSSRLYLPTTELNGTYGVDPQFVNATAGDYHLAATSPARNVGAYALPT